MRKNQTGQMLVMYAVALAVILVITGIVVDGGLMALSWWTLQEDADTACLAGLSYWLNQPLRGLWDVQLRKMHRVQLRETQHWRIWFVENRTPQNKSAP